MADVIDALIAEALGEGPQGIAAVAHVIAARARATGKTPEQIVNEAGQFSGVSNPGRVVAQAMQDPATRAQVQQIWTGVQSGQISNPYPRASHFHTPQVNPSWASSFERLGQLGNHIFYADGNVGGQPASSSKVATPVMVAARRTDGWPTARPEVTGQSPATTSRSRAAQDWLTYTNQGATRSQPLDDRLVQAMSFLPDMGITMNVYSGGQPSEGNGDRIGSERHDHGNAGDVMFYQNGRMLDWNNPADIPILSNIVSEAKSRGVTGIGAGNDYMGPGRMHIGFGTPAVWGAGGVGANAPEWLQSAYYGTPAAPPAVQAINAAAPTPSPMQAPSWWSNPAQFVQTAMGGVAAPVMTAASDPKVKQNAIGAMLGSVDGRTAVMKALMNRNVGPAPVMKAGHVPGGTLATAVSGKGNAPVTLMKAAGSGPGQKHMNMDVYRHNAEQLGPGNMNQNAINSALASGKTLVKLA